MLIENGPTRGKSGDIELVCKSFVGEGEIVDIFPDTYQVSSSNGDGQEMEDDLGIAKRKISK